MYQERKFPFSLPHFTPNPNPIQKELGTSLQSLMRQGEGTT